MDYLMMLALNARTSINLLLEGLIVGGVEHLIGVLRVGVFIPPQCTVPLLNTSNEIVLDLPLFNNGLSTSLFL